MNQFELLDIQYIKLRSKDNAKEAFKTLQSEYAFMKNLNNYPGGL